MKIMGLQSKKTYASRLVVPRDLGKIFFYIGSSRIKFEYDYSKPYEIWVDDRKAFKVCSIIDRKYFGIKPKRKKYTFTRTKPISQLSRVS